MLDAATRKVKCDINMLYWGRVSYLVQKASGKSGARRAIRMLLAILDVAPVNRAVLDAAVGGAFDDFEDGVVACAALHDGADVIVTRNARHFRGAKVPVQSPAEFLTMVRAGRG